jgi:hypothetical protein
MKLASDARFAVAVSLLCGWALTSHADPAGLVREANTALRSAQSAMFSGKVQDATAQLATASERIAALEKEAPDHAQLTTLKRQLERQRSDLERRGGTKTTAAQAPVESPAAATAPGTAPGAAGAKLPGGVTSRIRTLDAELAKAAEVLNKPGVASTEWRREAANGHLEAARGLLADIVKGYGAQVPAEHPEMVAVRDRLASAERDVAALGAKLAAADAERQDAAQAREGQSKEWMEKLRPYIDFHGEKRLLDEPTSVAANLRGQTLFRDEAVALLKALKETAFPQGKTDELDEWAAKLEKVLAEFGQTFERSVENVLAKPRADLDRLEKEMAEKLKATAAAIPVAGEVLTALRRQTADVADVLPPKAPEPQALEKRIAALEAQNAELRKRWIANVRVKDDAYKGEDAAALKEQAAAVVEKAKPGSKILRTTVASDAWEEERVTEWTDTTHSAVRHRITRFVTAQVAAKEGQDAVLHTLHLAQDRNVDGAWGRTYGHIMFTDPAVEANLLK